MFWHQVKQVGQSRPASQTILVSNGGKKEVRGSVAAAAAAIEKGNKDDQGKWMYDEVCTNMYIYIYMYMYIHMYMYMESWIRDE